MLVTVQVLILIQAIKAINIEEINSRFKEFKKLEERSLVFTYFVMTVSVSFEWSTR